MNKAFVFVVCGAAEHTETLTVAHEYLRLRTKFPIFIITDQQRNEIPIALSHVIDIATPTEYTNHQAAIYLKTGLHRFLPTGFNYAYLDTDILAIGNHIDEVFDAFKSPITFAPDHCVVQDFSAYAVNCECLQTWQSDWDRYQAAYDELDQNKTLHLSKELSAQKKLLLHYFADIQTKFFIRLFYALKYMFAFRKFTLKNTFVFDKKHRVWQNLSGEILLHETPNKAIAKRAGLRYHSLLRTWKTNSGKPLWEAKCTHLNAALKQKFATPEIPATWQHWNGGFFLFNDESKVFLDRWHEWSVALFTDPKFKTRDQGSLIATVWSMALNEHPTLHQKWNFLLDYHSNQIVFNAAQETFRIQNGASFKPEFVHVYHHWNDSTWDLWQWLLSKKIPA